MPFGMISRHYKDYTLITTNYPLIDPLMTPGALIIITYQLFFILHNSIRGVDRILCIILTKNYQPTRTVPTKTQGYTLIMTNYILIAIIRGQLWPEVF